MNIVVRFLNKIQMTQSRYLEKEWNQDRTHPNMTKQLICLIWLIKNSYRAMKYFSTRGRSNGLSFEEASKLYQELIESQLK